MNFRFALQLLALLVVTFVPLSDALAESRLQPGQALAEGQGLISPNRQYQLIMQHDGNLVIYTKAGQPIWHSHTYNTAANQVVMQSDGNLVLYTGNSEPVWHTHSYQYPDQGVYASMQDDGNFVLYTTAGTPIWDSKGYVRGTQIPVSGTIDHTRFLSGMRSAFGSLNRSKIDAIDFLLSKMQNDTRPARENPDVWVRQLAYLFATIKHEVANTYLPITEYGNTNCPRYEGGCTYKGRGYVQLTHRTNYRTMSPVVGVDLVAFQKRALEPETAYTIMSYGMFNGSFTTRKLDTYIRSGLTDYYSARKVVNGSDKANLIKGYAQTFQRILENSTSASNGKYSR